MLSLLIPLISLSVVGCQKTYHVAFLGFEDPTAPSLQFLSTDSTPGTIETELNGCGSLNFNTEITQVTNPCISNFFPERSNISASRGVKIDATSDNAIHVNVKHNGADEGFLALPDVALGNEYYVASFCRFGGFCQFSVTPVEDGTSVLVRFPVHVAGATVCVTGGDGNSVNSNVEVPFLLNEFDVLHFESEYDLTGTYITSDKKLAVFAGARNVPSATGGESHMIEQLLPVNKWGTQFYVVPNTHNPAGDEIIIITSVAATKIEIGGFSPFFISRAGQFVTRRFDNGIFTSITASYPVLVVQLMSIDIYNDTTHVQGTPSMVLVQSENHFKDAYYFKCEASPCGDGSVPGIFLAVVAKENYTSSINMPGSLSPVWEPVLNLDMMAAMVDFASLSSDPVIMSTGNNPFGLYGYFKRSRASLVGLNLDDEFEAEGCVPTSPAPGDGVDNDCDGEIDEEFCVEADLSNSFTLTENTPKSLAIGGTSLVIFAIKSCHVTFVTLTTKAPSTTYVLLELSPDHIHAHVCDDDCDDSNSQNKDLSVGDCNSGATPYWISTAISPGNLLIDEGTDTSSTSAVSLPFADILDSISFTSIFPGAEVEIDLLAKDCGKIISAVADIWGNTFYVPVKSSDEDFIFLITTGSNSNNVSVQISTGDETGSYLTTGSVYTWTLSKNDLSSGLGNSYKGVNCYNVEKNRRVKLQWLEHLWDSENIHETGVVRAKECYSQRYVRRHNNMIRYLFDFLQDEGFHVFPTDVLGTAFHVIDHDGTPINQNVVAMTTDYETTIKLNTEQVLQKRDFYDEGGFIGPLIATKPVVIYSSNENGAFVAQMPPIESLGMQYYIPAIDLVTVGATGKLLVTSVEDSTYVIVKGAYDEGTELDYIGSPIRRDIDDNTIMSVQSSKPVLVSVLLTSSSGDWASLVTIPPSNQYKDIHYFPAVTGNLLWTKAVDKNGTEVTSLVDMTPKMLQYATPAFSLTFVKLDDSTYGLGSDTVIVIKGDENVTDINKVCTLSDATVGDNIDNDCDGLVDEEYCYTTNIPGSIDYDIDGEFNEDCKIASSPYTESQQSLGVPTSPTPCPSITPPVVTTTPTTGSNLGTATPTIPSSSGGGLEPGIEFTDSGINFLGTTAGPSTTTTGQGTGTTQAPEETCTTDCVIPCGWKDVQNYTIEEINEKVAEIQAKLKIDKAILSAQKRKKTSATDNRPTAMGIGYIGLGFLIATIGSIVLLDLTSIARDLRLLRENLHDVFAQ